MREREESLTTICRSSGVGGEPAASKVYMPVAADDKNQNARLMPFVEKKVKVTGTLLEKGGLAGLTIKTIEPAQ